MTVTATGTCKLQMRKGEGRVYMALVVKKEGASEGQYRIYLRNKISGRDRFLDVASERLDSLVDYCLDELGRTYMVLSEQEFRAWYVLAVTDTKFDEKGA